MAISTFTCTTCEHCGRQITLESPPSTERYNRAEIHLCEYSSMLLPRHIVEENGDGSHAVHLDGYYCSPQCLIERINKELHRDVKFDGPKKKR